METSLSGASDPERKDGGDASIPEPGREILPEWRIGYGVEEEAF